MNCKIVLHSILRQNLPPESKGEVFIDLKEGATLADVLRQLDLPVDAVCVLNNQLETNKTRILKEGDILHIFRPAPIW